MIKLCLHRKFAIQGFDEFMNLVLDDAVEVFVKENKPRKELGTIVTFSCLRNTD